MHTVVLIDNWGFSFSRRDPETTGAVNDFVRETVRYYPQLSEELIRVLGVHPGNFILLELREELGRYAERKLRDHKVEVIKGPPVANYDGVVLDT